MILLVPVTGRRAVIVPQRDGRRRIGGDGVVLMHRCRRVLVPVAPVAMMVIVMVMMVTGELRQQLDRAIVVRVDMGMIAARMRVKEDRAARNADVEREERSGDCAKARELAANASHRCTDV